MNLSAPIVYNALSINSVTTTSGGVPSSGYLVDGLDIFPTGARAYVEDRAMQDGGQASDIYLKPQPMQLIVSVYGSTSGDYWDKVQNLRRAFNPRIAYEADSINLGFLPLTFYQPTANIATWPTSTYPYGIPMQYEVRPSGRIGEAVRRDNSGGVSTKGNAGRFIVPLMAISPFKVGQTLRSASIANPSLTTAQTTAFTLNGDYYSWPTFWITRSTGATSSVTVKIQWGSISVQITSMPLAAGEDVFLEAKNRKLFLRAAGMDTNYASYMTVTGTWGPLSATGGNIVVTVTTAPSNMSVYVRARDTFT